MVDGVLESCTSLVSVGIGWTTRAKIYISISFFFLLLGGGQFRPIMPKTIAVIDQFGRVCSISYLATTMTMGTTNTRRNF